MANRAGRDRPRRPGRREPFLEPKPRILILCEGKNTEPQYFEQFAKHHRNPLVEVVVEGRMGVPLTIVRAAKGRKKAADDEARRRTEPYLNYEAVWCVFDVDEHPNLAQAKDEAVQSGIELAISNPCF